LREWAHAVVDGLLLNLLCRYGGFDHGAQRRGDFQQLVGGDPAGKAQVVALVATLTLVESFVSAQAQCLTYAVTDDFFFQAMRAVAPDQPLRQNSQQAGVEQVGGNADFQQTGHGGGGAVGMQGAEYQVAGQGTFGGHQGGFLVADFAHHDYIRVVAQDVSQRAGEGVADLRLDLDLADAVDLVFHRVFHGDDVDPAGLDAVQRGVQGGALARTGRAGDQYDALVVADQAAKTLDVS